MESAPPAQQAPPSAETAAAAADQHASTGGDFPRASLQAMPAVVAWATSTLLGSKGMLNLMATGGRGLSAAYSPHVRSLRLKVPRDVSSTATYADCGPVLASLLSRFPGLERLDASSPGIVFLLGMSLNEREGLRLPKLRVLRVPVGQPGTQQDRCLRLLAAAMFHRLHALETLHITSGAIDYDGSEGGQALVRALANRACPLLRDLQLSDVADKQSFMPLALGLHMRSGHLTFDSDDEEDEDEGGSEANRQERREQRRKERQELPPPPTPLRSLTLRGGREIGGEIGVLLAGKALLDLSSLTILTSSLSAEGSKAIASFLDAARQQGKPGLTELVIMGCGGGSAAPILRSLKAGASAGLTVLRLQGCDMGEEGTRLLADLLSSGGLRQLKELSASDAHMPVMLDGLRKGGVRLKTLCLYYSQKGGQEDKARALLSALKDGVLAEGFEQLEVVFCGLGEAGIMPVLDLLHDRQAPLPCRPTLQTLALLDWRKQHGGKEHGKVDGPGGREALERIEAKGKEVKDSGACPRLQTCNLCIYVMGCCCHGEGGHEH